jgi:hypothetical protein
VSVDFDPVRLGSRRRRVDPVIVGVIVVVVALAVAVIKPWDKPATPRAAGPSVAVVAPIPSATRAPAVARSTAAPAPPSSIPVSWAEVASAITSHDSWGVRVITVDQRGFNPATGPSSYHELWSAATTIGGVETAIVGTYVDPLSLLGITVPRATGARAVRIWRVHRGDQMEWVDAVPLAAQPTDASTLFVRPGANGAPLTPWQPGQYRVDVLGVDGIHRLAVLVPDPFGVVPPLDTWTPDRLAVVPASESDPSSVRIGLFATVDGTGVSLPARQTGTLDDDEAWLDLATSPNEVVATAYLPRATGLGVMLTSHAAVAWATIRRLAPDAFFVAPKAFGGITESRRTPYVLFAAPGDGVWSPGVYAISVAWSDAAGDHNGTWHVELRPGLG